MSLDLLWIFSAAGKPTFAYFKVDYIPDDVWAA